MPVAAALVGELVGAFELGIAAQLFGLDRSDDGLPSWQLEVCADGLGPPRTTSGFAVETTTGLDALATSDLVVVPTWPTLDAPLPRRVAAALRDAFEAGTPMFSICTGAFALAGAGLLDGRRATTHWQFTRRLARAHPRVTVERDPLYVEDGPVLTSAGAAAGIDAGLHLLRQRHGAAVVAAIARRMVVPPHRDGGQAQYVEHPISPTSADDPIASVMAEVLRRLDEPLSVADMAALAHQSPRTFARRFRDATGTTPHRWLTDRRLDAAEQLLETTDRTVARVAGDTGLGSAETLRRHLADRRSTTPTAHRRRFRATATVR